MKRALWGSCLLAVLSVSPHAFARADFDAAAGRLRLSGDALRTFDFENEDALAGTELLTWNTDQGFPALEHVPVAKGDLAPFFTTEEDDALEGARALRLTKGKGLALTDAGLFAELAKGRFEVKLWARADGAAPQVQVAYDQELEGALGGFTSFAQVRAIRTGRQTSDGWAEYSTGPIDGAAFDVPARAILIAPSPYASTNAAFVIDALEIEKVDGKPTAPAACTQQNVDQVCGATGDCMFGHCVSSTITWGALPSASHRKEIAERWSFWSTRLIGDRNALKNGIAILTPQARALADSAPSSRQFFGGMARLVNLLRDNHTSFGSPTSFSTIAPQIQQGSSSVLGACFGLVEKDLMGGGLGFAVFRASDKPTSAIPLQKGDVIAKIDGQDPKAWVDENWPRFATTLPNDAGSDWGAVAVDLSRLLTTRASTVSIARCASAGACSGDALQTIDIPIGELAYKAVTGQIQPGSRSFACSSRFTPSVSQLAPASNTGEDPVSIETGAGGETRAQFDGFVADKNWKASMTSIFAGRPAKVMMDARDGHGGLYDAVEHLFGLVRGTADPMGVLSIGRGSVSLLDPPWLLDRVTSCTSESMQNQWACFLGLSNGFLATVADPPGSASKIAWLNTRDVSANDFMPRLFQGKAGFRIFAPHVTSGAFGSVVQLPPVSSGWTGGSIQIQDSRFAGDATGLKEARWESGHGVPPDEVVVQKLSDTLAGVDTIITAALTWLETP